MQPPKPPRTAKIVNDPDKGIHGVNGIPGTNKGQGKYYTKEWYENADGQGVWDTPQGQARLAKIAKQMGLDRIPSAADFPLDIDNAPPAPPTQGMRRVVADEDYDLNLDFTPENPFANDHSISVGIDADVPVTGGSYDYDLLDANSGRAYNPMTGYDDPNAPVTSPQLLHLGKAQDRTAPRVATVKPPEQVVSIPPSDFITTRSGATPGQQLLPGMNDYLRQQVDQNTWLGNFWHGFKRGGNFGFGEKGFYSRSAVTDRMPPEMLEDLGDAARVGVGVGRVAADIPGDGTRKFFWNMHPEDVIKTFGRKLIQDEGGSRMAMLVAPWAAGVALGVGSGNYNPLNLAEGGRTAGYAAVQADPDNPTQSTTPVSEMLIDRGMFGRKGKLLPWEQFKAERPDVSYEEYERYKNYLFNKDDNLLRSLTLGIAKGTLDGINGPELNVMGYGVTPLGAAAALGTLAAVKEGVKRFAHLRR